MRIKQFCIFAVTIFLSINVEAECIKGNCHNGQGIWVKGNYTYAGQFINGKKHGQGVDKEGDNRSYKIYNGSFKNDSYHGEGILYIYNRKESPYIFGTFKNGNLSNNTEVLMKFENGVDAYYKVTTSGSSSSLALIEEKTANLFCRKNPTYISCVNRFVWNNKEAIMSLMAVGYIGSVVNSNQRLSFNDISNGINILADTLNKRREERAQEFANRISRKLGIGN